jgi:predicted anti-sigma-YlaC factor YlaD
MSCREASALMSQRLERPLSALERVGLWLHLRACAACRRFEGQLALLRDAMRRYRA